jgi:hypothetical protein
MPPGLWRCRQPTAARRAGGGQGRRGCAAGLAAVRFQPVDPGDELVPFLGRERQHAVFQFGRWRPRKPPKATSRPPQSVLIARGLRPQSHLRATPMRPQCDPKATPGGMQKAECRMQKGRIKPPKDIINWSHKVGFGDRARPGRCQPAPSPGGSQTRTVNERCGPRMWLAGAPATAPGAGAVPSRRCALSPTSRCLVLKAVAGPHFQ